MERPGLALIALAGLLAGCDSAPARQAYAIPGAQGERVTVEVLNATDRGGLARAATATLRRAGLDVVYFGNAAPAGAGADSTRILVRRGDRDRGERVRRALGVGVVTVQLDSTRLLDVSVLLGADFSPRLEVHP
ncbi:MAG TPA: LytR C-terminal domain-containing protein [Gemmatimonadales bacterium]|nr:LytR C-terminal domain-containing protein [Gemmatimonadales bacterium]